MKFLYNFSIYMASFFLKIVAFFSPKIKLFVQGRKNIFHFLEKNIDKNASYIWFHTASLGEFEQGLPVIKALRNDYKIIVSFFSPSGFEVKKNTTDADLVVYLPLDTPENAQKFIDLVQPKIAVFVKYEFWINYLNYLKIKQIPTFLLSGIFRENQIFFKPYGKFMRDCLSCFTHFFVQNETSKKLLQLLDFQNVTISGDTRFDRVFEILHRNNSLAFIEEFKGKSLLMVFGSSWESDEEIYLNFINHCSENIKFIIAPHQIKAEKMQLFRQKIAKKTAFFSERENLQLSDYQVLIIDTIGILTKIYSYANIAYVGGGMGNSGLHNVLEPAVFGIPVIIGKNYEKFEEAKALVAQKGIISVKNADEFSKNTDFLIKNEEKRNEIGKINASFINLNKGATEIFIEFLKKYKI